MNQTGTAEFNHQVLIAVDESENAEQAVRYVGFVLGKTPGFAVTILHIIPDPETDYFPNQDEKDNYLKNYSQRIGRTLERYLHILLEAGFSADRVKTESTLRYCPSMAECILSEREEKDFGTIVVGRQGISRKEAFLFGSVANKIVNHAKDCTVWVVG